MRKITIMPTADVKSDLDQAYSPLDLAQRYTTSGQEILGCDRRRDGGYNVWMA
jgi:hypothetical protein